MRRLLAFVLLAGSLRAQDLAAKADAFVREFVAQHRFQGAVALGRDGKPLFRKAYGLANAEWDVANTPDTKFRLGSVTKQFTAALILQLAEQGKLDLRDSIRKYYPEAPPSWTAVTLRHLLAHQSGIPSYTDLPDFFSKQAGVARTPVEIIRLTQDKPLEFQPGSKYRYDNTGYILLGYVIEKVTGRSYEEHLRKAILDPLGMKNTGFDHYTDILPRRADGYTYERRALRRAPFLDMSLPYAAGSLYSTVDDLLTWDQALYGDRVLSAASKEKMWTPNLNDYGYGWMILQRYGERVYEHGGGINGFNSMIVRMPARKLIAVVLSNVETDAAGPIAAGLVGLALGKPVSASKHVGIQLAPEAMRRFEGVYALNASFKLTFRVEGSRLMAQATDQAAAPLQASGPTTFFDDRIGAELEFAPDASAVTLRQNGAELRLKRQ